MEDSLVSVEGVEYIPPVVTLNRTKSLPNGRLSCERGGGRISSPLWGHSTKQKAFQTEDSLVSAEGSNIIPPVGTLNKTKSLPNGRLSCDRGGVEYHPPVGTLNKTKSLPNGRLSCECGGGGISSPCGDTQQNKKPSKRKTL